MTLAIVIIKSFYFFENKLQKFLTDYKNSDFSKFDYHGFMHMLSELEPEIRKSADRLEKYIPDENISIIEAEEIIRISILKMSLRENLAKYADSIYQNKLDKREAKYTTNELLKKINLINSALKDLESSIRK